MNALAAQDSPASCLRQCRDRYLEIFSDASAGKIIFYLFAMGLMVSEGFAYLEFRIHHFLGLLLLPFLARKIFADKMSLSIFRMKNFGLNFFIILFIWNVASLAWVQDTSAWFHYIFYLANGLFVLLAFFVYLKDAKDMLDLCLVLCPIVVLEYAVGILEICANVRWPVSRLSIDDWRPTGFHWEPHRFGLFVLLTWPFLFVLLPRRICKLAALLFAAILIFYCASRSLIYGFIIECAILFVISLKKKLTFVRNMGIIAAATFVAAIILFPYKSAHKHTKHIYRLKSVFHLPLDYFTYTKDSLNLLERHHTDDGHLVDCRNINQNIHRKNIRRNGRQVSSALERSYMSVMALKTLSCSPWWRGVGAGNTNINTKGSNLARDKMDLHNFWLEILVGSGIYMFALFAFWALLLCSKLIREIKVMPAGSLPNSPEFPLMIALGGLSVGVVSVSTPVYLQCFWVFVAFAVFIMKRPFVDAHDQ